MQATMVGMHRRWSRGWLFALVMGLVMALSGCAPAVPGTQRPAEPRPVTSSARSTAAERGAAAAVAGTAPSDHDGRRTRTVRALVLLHRWDSARAAAYASGDATRLRRLYVRGSGAGAADVRQLRRYAARGLVVTGMRRQVLEAHVRRWTRDRLVLRLADRLVGAVAVGGGTRTRLPSAGAHRWLLGFERHDRRWSLGRAEER